MPDPRGHGQHLRSDYQRVTDWLVRDAGQGLGILYDPVRDIFVFSPFDGTRKLIIINPDTLVATDITPTTGATPPALASTGQHMYGRFFYVASQDIYVALVNASDSTSFVYKPGPFRAQP